MKINVGNYVRNKYGIAKVLEISEDVVKQIQTIKFDRPICFFVNPKTGEEKNRTNILPITPNIDLDKINFSSDIIDLLEEHDFVRMEDRGFTYYEIEKDWNGKMSLKDIGWDEYEELDESNINEIISIVTHEQMEAMEYKIER